MLLEFGAKNYYSFKEGFEISMRLNSGCPSDISKNKNYSNILCLKGANASGKTNALKALSFLAKFCCHSFNEKPEDKIQVESFLGNSDPIEFYIVFSQEGIEYRYELALTQDEIISEVLYKKEKRQVKIIHRKMNKIQTIHPNYKSLKKIKLRSNASFISTANQYEISQIKMIYQLFNFIFPYALDSFFGLWSYLDYKTISIISKPYNDDKESLDFMKDILFRCDLGISDIKIQMKTDEKEEVYYPVFEHKVGESKYNLPFINQSSGTKSLYAQLNKYFIILKVGGILVLDEFDINLHPDILPVLVQLFDDPKINTKDAQLLFTTHNSDIMDKLGKYRTVLVAKENNESYLYRLDEIPGDILRNDRPISPIYKSGKIGGVPKL